MFCLTAPSRLSIVAVGPKLTRHIKESIKRWFRLTREDTRSNTGIRANPIRHVVEQQTGAENRQHKCRIVQ